MTTLKNTLHARLNSAETNRKHRKVTMGKTLAEEVSLGYDICLPEVLDRYYGLSAVNLLLNRNQLARLISNLIKDEEKLTYAQANKIVEFTLTKFKI